MKYSVRVSSCIRVRFVTLKFTLAFVTSWMLTIEFQATSVEGLPWPAQNLQKCIDEAEGCCASIYVGEPIKFKFQHHLPMRVRPAAHLVDDVYIAKYQRAMELMRALPDSDGRSFLNQYRLHCVYGNRRLYYEGVDSRVDIHQNWLFFPWHRMYVYFHERILAKLIADDDFALPFWNWDNQWKDEPQANVVPKVYAEKKNFNADGINKTSSLYDPDRNKCAQAPNIVYFQQPLNCSSGILDEVRDGNSNIMYSHMVSAGVTPLTFFGRPYRFGDIGVIGKGSVEGVPHGSIHRWVNIFDMAVFKDAASDPVFFGHHAQMDRLWSVWKTIPGRYRTEISDPDYLNSEFTFYDEDGKAVSASISQFLNTDLLRYKYQEVPIPWLSGAEVKENNDIGFCNPKSDISALIARTKTLKKPINISTGPATFKVKRPGRTSSNIDHGEEILELRGELTWAKKITWMCAWAFLPDANHKTTSYGCLELLGCTSTSPITLTMLYNPPREFVWQLGIRRKLEHTGRSHFRDLVVTITKAGDENQTDLLVTGAKIMYSKL